MQLDSLMTLQVSEDCDRARMSLTASASDLELMESADMTDMTMSSFTEKGSRSALASGGIFLLIWSGSF